jgi:predicted transcriptional regulator of viral defense system
MKNMFKKGFIQRSKKGAYKIYTIKVGTEKVAIKEGVEISAPKKPVETKEVK